MTRADKLAFIGNVAPAAQSSQAKCGIPASVTIAQAILESSDKLGNWGQSQLARQCNNYFGIKDADHENYQEFITKEFKKVNGQLVAVNERARFEKYASIDACFLAHAKLLSGANRYQPAMDAVDDPLAFALQLYKCGYSTNPKYPKLLADLIRQWNLSRYDAPTARGVKA